MPADHHLSVSNSGESVVECKEVLKLVLPDVLAERFKARYNTQSGLLFLLQWTSNQLFAEAEFLGQMDRSLKAKRARHRKGGKVQRGNLELPVQVRGAWWCRKPSLILVSSGHRETAAQHI